MVMKQDELAGTAVLEHAEKILFVETCLKVISFWLPPHFQPSFCAVLQRRCMRGDSVDGVYAGVGQMRLNACVPQHTAENQEVEKS